ncbi:hypothetical protein SAMN04489867_0381 [Pedococcus dokdonensis]|uniref:WD40-like Beta Propeller Repeat n=1 Tax=Pedococcus dokdonensis TaxID=443156 RepID=A0A1H0LSA0_9MICO|nr:hypothetical protein [Pedococcus dokdonensis]SDO70963.1 hypothetical protein SAMN04489867_0381 [Pedococcus dokdonensis]
MRCPRRLAAALLAAAVLAATLLAVGVVGVPSRARAATSATGRVDFRFEDDRIDESSGLALSVRHPHTVWTANDSGDSARVFAVDTRTGRTVGVHRFDAEVRDVEALAITPQGRMLVADIGDNGTSRDVVRIFWFDEPALGSTSGPRAASWELGYPDGPHDAEALAVDPRSGRILVITKDRVGGIYALPKSPSRRGVNRLTRVGAAPSTVTDAVFLPDGSALAVRTYTSLHLLDPDTFAGRGSSLLPLRPQGETLALAPDEDGVLVGSEGKRSRVQQVEVPALPGASGSGTATAPPTSTSSVTPTTTPPSQAPTSVAPRPPAAEPDSGFWTPTVVVVLGLASLLLAGVVFLVVRALWPERR